MIRLCKSCGMKYFIDGDLVASPINKLCRACRPKEISPGLPQQPSKVNFTSNVPSDTEVASVFPFKSSSSTTIYECRLYKNGSTSCNCPGWTRRTLTTINGDIYRECKHTKEVDAKKGPILAALAGTPVTTSGSTQSYTSVASTSQRFTPRPTAHAAPKPIRRFDLDA